MNKIKDLQECSCALVYIETDELPFAHNGLRRRRCCVLLLL